VPAQAEDEAVTITYVGHSTYLIETPGGVSIATDYNGFSGPVDLPTVATMNKAHSGHNTPMPDPAIEHVLRGWNPAGGPADHDLVVGDTYIRNVTTDIRAGFTGMEADGNSIFIFEVAGLCIGHLGHLHHVLTPEHLAEIGRLDIVMVPIDGGLTLGAEAMGSVVRELRAALILPMHRIGPPISEFLNLFDESYAREFSTQASLTVSLRSLPDRPTIHVLQGV
jgi:L-ascorbate metabolism protein UlaG (beta-lactamase superfamily)